MIQIYAIIFLQFTEKRGNRIFLSLVCNAVVVVMVVVVVVDAVVEHQVDKVTSFWRFFLSPISIQAIVCLCVSFARNALVWVRFAFCLHFSPSGAVLPKIIPTSYQLYDRVCLFLFFFWLFFPSILFAIILPYLRVR